MPINRLAYTKNSASQPASGGVAYKANSYNCSNATSKVVSLNGTWKTDSISFTVDPLYRYTVHVRNSASIGTTSINIDFIEVYGEASASYLTCSEDSGGYRFGFNGQEKDNEITGVEGSHNTAEFWMYDTRLGRRWNVDPVDQISISNYVCFRNNPIFNIDIKGNKSEGWIKGSDGKVSYDKDINSQSDLKDAQRIGKLCDYTYEGQQALVTHDDQVYFGDENGKLHNQMPLPMVTIVADPMHQYYTNQINKKKEEYDLLGMFDYFLRREFRISPDGDNSGEIGIAGSLEINTAVAFGSGYSYSGGIFWTANNKATVYATEQHITHGIVFSIGTQASMYQDIKGDGVTADDFTGKGWQSSMGLGPFGYSESYNYNSKTGNYGDQYIGRGFSIGLGLKGLPVGYSSGRTFTRPLK